MVLLPASRKYSGGRKRRNTPILRTILLLVLSHNVWNTLQCVPISSQPRQPVLPVEQEGAGTDFYDGDNNELSDGNEYNTFGGNTPIEKKDGESRPELPANYQPPSDQTVQDCSFRLVDSIRSFCGPNNFYDPNNFFALNTSAVVESKTLPEILLQRTQKRSQRETMRRRMTRSLVNECCIKSCQIKAFAKFCSDESRIPRIYTKSKQNQAQPTETEEVEEPKVVAPLPKEQEPDAYVQLPHSPTGTPEPAMYFPLFHFIKFLHHQFGHKNAHNPRQTDGQRDPDVVSSGNSMDSQQLGSENERDLPQPQPRIQNHRSNSRQFFLSNSQQYREQTQQQRQRQHVPAVHSADYFPNYRPNEHERFEGNPYQSIADDDEQENSGGVGIGFSTNNANNNHQQRTRVVNQHRNRQFASNNRARTTGDALNRGTVTNQLSYPSKNNFVHHRQGQGQQSRRRGSSNVVTSTIAPDMRIYRLQPGTDDEAPYGIGKKK